MPEDTCSWRGLCCWPPMYPETAVVTPGTFSKASSVHQKQPAAKVAFSVFCAKPGNVTTVKKANSRNLFMGGPECSWSGWSWLVSLPYTVNAALARTLSVHVQRALRKGRGH